MSGRRNDPLMAGDCGCHDGHQIQNCRRCAIIASYGKEEQDRVQAFCQMLEMGTSLLVSPG